ncbi:MAG: hypothetical protein V3T24_03180, partial [Longimicrobiales bacterium]
MPDKVFLVHGWSVDSTETYQALHIRLAVNGYQLHEVFLGRYVSLDDHVEVADLARAMDRALSDVLGKGSWKGERFHIVTHSTGALPVRHWIAELYGGKKLEGRPLKNVVFLAGPQFGSRLAHHGKSMLAHIKWGGETGKKILNALELGSAYSWWLNEQWLTPANWKSKGIRPFCLIGDRVKANFLVRRVLPAAAEKGSDGVIRVPAGNLNFRRYEVDLVKKRSRRAGDITGVPFGALADYTHSGDETGIVNSITSKSTRQNHQALRLLLQCLSVANKADYDKAAADLARTTKATRKKRGAYGQIDFRFRDVDGRPVEDYSIILGYLDGNTVKPSKVVAHTHKNTVDPHHFTFFLNMAKLETGRTFVLQLTAHTDTPLVNFSDDWHPTYSEDQITSLLVENQTTQVDVILDREPDRKL